MPTIRIIKNDSYQEDVDSSENNLCSMLSGSRVDAPSIVFNASGEWSWSPLISMYCYHFSLIIATYLAYSKINHCPYTR